MFRRKRGFVDWNTYERAKDFADLFYWQQKIRKENMRR